MTIHLEPFIRYLPAWLMVLFRLSGIFIFAPVLGSRIVPVRVKVFLALGLSFCVFPALMWGGTPSHGHLMAVVEQGIPSLWATGYMVAMELMIGLVIGYGVALPMIAMQMGGRVMDQQMGLGIAGVINPEFDEETGIISEFYFLFATTLFVIMGGHVVLFQILVESFNNISIGGFTVDSTIVAMLIGMLDTVFALAMRVAAPLLCLIFLETIAMGFITRTVPQVNIMSVGFALRILAGVTIMIVALGVQDAVYIDALREMIAEVRLVITGK